MPQLSLEQSIRRKSLSAMLSVILVASVLTAFVSFSTIQNAIEQNHNENLITFENNVAQAIAALQDELVQLSQNDLIINALIDDHARKDYLPFLFESFSLSHAPEEQLLYTDFSANVIMSTPTGDIKHWQQAPNWQQDVLENGHRFLHLNKTGVFFATPVLYADLAEGALLLYLPSLKSLVRRIELGLNKQLDYTILNKAGEVLFHLPSDHDQTKSQTNVFEPVTFGLEGQGLHFISQQDPVLAYSNFLRLISYFILAFVLVGLAGYYIVKLSAQSATRSLNDLKQALDSANSQQQTLHFNANDVREVTSLKHAYNRLFSRLDTASYSVQQFEAIIDSMSEYILVCDPQGDVILWNTKLEDFIASLALSEPYARNFKHQDFLPDDLTKYKTAEAIEQTYELRGGGRAYVSWQCRSFKQDRQGSHGFVYVGTDLSKQRAMQAELQIKNHAIDEANTAIFISETGPQMRINYVNSAFVALTGYLPDDIIDQSYELLLGADTKTANIKSIKRAIENALPISLTHIAYNQDGHSFYNQLTLSPITGEDQDTRYVLGLLSDVTQREKLNSYLEQAKTKAEENAALKASFLASMSHEIRTPMNGVLGMLHLLLNSELEGQQKHHAMLAKSSADSLLNIIDDILDFSKIEAGKLTIEAQSFDLPMMLAELCRTHMLKAKQNDTEVLLDLSELRIRNITSDPVRIRQVLSNLLGNAVKFTKSGAVCVKVWHRDYQDYSELHCSIADTGIGVPPERQAQIFDSFTQADNSTTRNFGGTGLGLTICKQLVQAMGGEIKLDSQIDVGSTFTFFIRLHKKPTSEEYQRPNNAEHLKALVIEPKFETCDNIARTLQSFGIDAFCALDMSEAKALLSEHVVQLCIINSDFVTQENHKCIQCILSNHAQSIKIVILAPIDISKTTFQNYERQATTLVKPLTLDDLRAVIQDLPNATIGANVSSHCELIKHQLDPSIKPVTIINTPAEPSREQSSNAPNWGTNCHILVVEDNSINQAVAKAMLEQLGCQVDIAENGAQALERIKTKPAGFYQLVFMDCQMPIMDGYEATRSIRQGVVGESNRDMLIVALTANAISGDKDHCIAAGMNDYLSKPIDADALALTLSRHLVLKND